MNIKEKYMLGEKPNVILSNPDTIWIAGGSVRRWFTGEKQNSDIDVFCVSDNDEKVFIEDNKLEIELTNNRYTIFKNSVIQMISVPRFKSPIDCINHFDFTICQFAYDGDIIIATEEAIISTLRKHLGTNEIQEGYELDSLRRAFKYAEVGYYPCIGTLKCIAESFRRENIDLENQVQISPGGGQRSIRWD